MRRLNITNALHSRMFGHVYVDDHEIRRLIETGISRLAEMHAISGLAQPLLKQSACELVFLVKQYVHGILGSPRGAWYRPHAAQAILRRAPHAIMSASRGSVSTETPRGAPPRIMPASRGSVSTETRRLSPRFVSVLYGRTGPPRAGAAPAAP